LHSARRRQGETTVRKSDLEEQIESLQDVLADIREMVYSALEPSEEAPEAQIESLRNALAEIEDVIDATLESVDDEDDVDDDEDEDEEEGR